MYFVGRKDTNFQRPGAKSYRLKVWIPTKINMLKSHPQCDGIRSWECPEAGRVGEAFINGVVCVCVCVCVSQSLVSNSATPWTVAHQAPMSMGFSRQEDWSGLPFPSRMNGVSTL